MTYWRRKIGLVVLLFGLVLIYIQPSGRALIPHDAASQEANAHPSFQYFQIDDFSLGEFFPNSSAGSLLNGVFSRDWSPNVQLRIFGVSIVEPFHFVTHVQNCYLLIRCFLVLPFEQHDIGYPFHIFW
ncbi:MAG: hypothetical protein ACWA6U_16895 [Breznakibacter sp.]